jgi:hypothetical protein
VLAHTLAECHRHIPPGAHSPSLASRTSRRPCKAARRSPRCCQALSSGRQSCTARVFLIPRILSTTEPGPLAGPLPWCCCGCCCQARPRADPGTLQLPRTARRAHAARAYHGDRRTTRAQGAAREARLRGPHARLGGAGTDRRGISERCCGPGPSEWAATEISRPCR